jgi:hypothetical protein
MDVATAKAEVEIQRLKTQAEIVITDSIRKRCPPGYGHRRFSGSGRRHHRPARARQGDICDENLKSTSANTGHPSSNPTRDIVSTETGDKPKNIRTLPSDFAELRLDPVNTLNVAMVKNTSIARTTLQLRAETFNAFDRVQFDARSTRPHPAASAG